MRGTMEISREEFHEEIIWATKCKICGSMMYAVESPETLYDIFCMDCGVTFFVGDKNE
jgi:hypothetical protein